MSLELPFDFGVAYRNHIFGLVQSQYLQLGKLTSELGR
jgi:hypothetical protein